MTLPEPHEYLGVDGVREAFDQLDEYYPDCFKTAEVGAEWSIPLNKHNIFFEKTSRHSISIIDVCIRLSDGSNGRMVAIQKDVLSPHGQHMKEENIKPYHGTYTPSYILKGPKLLLT